MLSILSKFVIHSYTTRFPRLFKQLRGNYDLINQVIQETTLGVGTPLYQMWQDLKKIIKNNQGEAATQTKNVEGNLEYSAEPPELVMRTLY